MSINFNLQQVFFKIKDKSIIEDYDSKDTNPDATLNRRHKDDEHKKRMFLSTAIFWYTCVMTLLIIATILISVLNIKGKICNIEFSAIPIDKRVMQTLLTTFFAHIVGLMWVVVSYLFPKKSKIDKQSS